MNEKEKLAPIKAMTFLPDIAYCLASTMIWGDVRSWSTDYRGPIMLCSAKGLACGLYSDYYKICVGGLALATADLVDCHPFCKDDYVGTGNACEESDFVNEEERDSFLQSRAAKLNTHHTFVFENVKPIIPFRAIGAIGIFDLDMPDHLEYLPERYTKDNYWRLAYAANIWQTDWYEKAEDVDAHFGNKNFSRYVSSRRKFVDKVFDKLSDEAVKDDSLCMPDEGYMGWRGMMMETSEAELFDYGRKNRWDAWKLDKYYRLKGPGSSMARKTRDELADVLGGEELEKALNWN